jgi:hypothetical protein
MHRSQVKNKSKCAVLSLALDDQRGVTEHEDLSWVLQLNLDL